jgi:hypothetical protein
LMYSVRMQSQKYNNLRSPDSRAITQRYEPPVKMADLQK